VHAADGAAAALGCAVVALESSTDRTDAHRFYERLGFADHRPARRFVRPVSASVLDVEGLAGRFLDAATRAATAVAGAVAGLEREGDDPVADLAAEAAALACLDELGLLVVSEEAGAVWPERAAPGRPWISLDPLDGTRNFRRGLPPFATSMGLVLDGRAVAGLVCDLTSGRRWWAAAGHGAWVDGRRCTPRPGGLAVLLSPGPGGHVEVPDGFERVRVCGSTATDLCRVADGSAGAFVGTARPVVYAHDIAGALAVLAEAGCHVVDAAGRWPGVTPDPTRTYAITATSAPT
jgi:3'(2'), 5'-bisphosphate nucleotidase